MAGDAAISRVFQAVLCVAGGLLLSAAPVSAHHSFAAEYDSDKPIKIAGKVTKVEMINPHSWIHVDVAGDDGKVTNYAVETGAPNVLYRQGWTRSSIRIGDEIVVEGSLAKNGSATINARSVTTPDGRRLLAGSSQDAPARQ